jgi:murein DD-endopeptidase MepM/ murein hydrolase activator NlpD
MPARSMLWERFSQAMKDGFKAKDSLKTSANRWRARPGRRWTSSRRPRPSKGSPRSTSAPSASQGPGALIVQWAPRRQEVIQGFRGPQATEARAATSYQTKPPPLPFDGEWTVFWGGRTLAENHHAATNDQRFAYDILIRTGLAQRRRDHGRAGWPLRPAHSAPGLGRSSSPSTAFPTTPTRHGPGAPAEPVILDHGNGEFSLLAHLQKGSVREGDTVRPATGSASAATAATPASRTCTTNADGGRVP